MEKSAGHKADDQADSGHRCVKMYCGTDHNSLERKDTFLCPEKAREGVTPPIEKKFFFTVVVYG